MAGFQLLASGAWDIVTPTFFCFLPVVILCLVWGAFELSRNANNKLSWAVNCAGTVLILPTLWGMFISPMMFWSLLVVLPVVLIFRSRFATSYWHGYSSVCCACLLIGQVDLWIYSSSLQLTTERRFGAGDLSFYQAYLLSLFVAWGATYWLASKRNGSSKTA